ncbi:MAG TPA: DMT family transporter [Clostridiales bacterium]|nr:DMT family transporter [Clostridiales bacterium]
MPKHSYKGEAALLLTALIWGSGFICVDYALQCGFPPGLLNTIRFLLGAAVLLLIINRKMKHISFAEIKTGFIAGSFYFLGFLFQTLGLQTIEVSSNALLTATNLLMVPFIARLFFKEKISIRVYIAVFACFLGIAVLNWSNGGIHFRTGDLLTLICAFAFACHIAYLGNNTDGKNTFHLTFLQLLTVGVLSSVYFLLFETGQTHQIQWGNGMLALVYLALFPSALCLFLQTYGQRRTPTAKSAILLSFESLFGAAFSVFLGLEPFTTRLLLGGSVIFLSVLWLEWSNSKKQKNGVLTP